MAEQKEKKTEDKKPIEEANDKKEESKPAVAKPKKAEKKEEPKIELEREYIIPLRKKVQKVQKYKRAKKAIRVIREFLARHMKVENRDLSKIKINKYLNQEIWFRGIKKPPAKIKVKVAKNSDGIVTVELAEIPEKVKWDIAHEEKIKKEAEKVKPKAPAKVKEKPAETDEEKKEEQEKEKASVEAGLEKQKAQAKQAKHTAKVSAKQPKHQVRKALKK